MVGLQTVVAALVANKPTVAAGGECWDDDSCSQHAARSRAPCVKMLERNESSSRPANVVDVVVEQLTTTVVAGAAVDEPLAVAPVPPIAVGGAPLAVGGGLFGALWGKL